MFVIIRPPLCQNKGEGKLFSPIKNIIKKSFVKITEKLQTFKEILKSNWGGVNNYIRLRFRKMVQKGGVKQFRPIRYSFFRLHRNIPVSILAEIIRMFNINKLNAKQIYNELKTKYKRDIVSYISITNILTHLRHVIADYIKYSYRKKQIGGSPTKNKIVAIDESLFLHEEIISKFG